MRIRGPVRTARQSTPAPKIVPAAVLYAVQPALPERFLSRHGDGQDAEADFLGLFTIHTDGAAEVEIVASTGSDALDALALQAARRYRFRPATQDGVPVDSFLRMRIAFDTY